MMEVIKIELTDGDGDIHDDGLPRLIVVNVTYSGGKVKRFPWQADKSITELFGALGNVKVSRENIEESITKEDIEAVRKVVLADAGIRSTEIERGDIVKCVKINGQNLGPAAGGTIFLRKGALYEVQEVLQVGYEVVEVNGAEMRRILADFDEVELVEKGKLSRAAKDLTLTAVRKCPACGEDTAIPKGDNGYMGACSGCQAMLRIGFHTATPDEAKLWQKERPGEPVPEFLNKDAEVAA
jgi:hypothetical protein